MTDPLGLSIGTTNLVAVRNGNPPVTHRSMLTLFPHRAPQIGVPTQKQTETGTLITGFVERIGGPNALVSADGSTHDPALLLVEALDAMICAAGGDAATSDITIAVPAYWGAVGVRALRDALRTHAGFVRSGMAPRLVSDAITALTALNSDARLPADGVVALLDFGGGGTSITLADAGAGFMPIAETVRHTGFSGEQIDQALLLHVLDGIGHAGEVDPESTAAVGQLGQLTEECRKAKERLSTDTATQLAAELPGHRAAVTVSRAELENLIEPRLNGLFAAFDDMLTRNKISPEDLSAVALAGGVASIPLIAQRLSAHSRVSVVTAVQPALAMAVGAVMFARRAEEPADEVEAPTTIAALAGPSTGSFRASTGSFSAATDSFDATTGGFGLPDYDVLVADDPATAVREFAWSQDDDTGNEPLPYVGEPYDDGFRAAPSQYLPKIEPPDERPQRRYRLPQLAFGLAALIAMMAIGGVAYTLTSSTGRQAPPAPASSTPVPPPPVSSPPPSASPPPPPPSATGPYAWAAKVKPSPGSSAGSVRVTTKSNSAV
ncbi:MAG: Hsp70 family protein [Mycobacterium sp.]